MTVIKTATYLPEVVAVFYKKIILALDVLI